MAPRPANPQVRVQRSVLVLVLALTVVVLLTAVVFDHSPATEHAAMVDPNRQYGAQEAQRTHDGYLMLGEQYWRRGDWQRAEEMLRAALLHQRESIEATRLLGLALFAQERYADAQLYLRQLPALRPTAYTSYTALALSQLCQGQLVEAQATLAAGMEHCGSAGEGPLSLVRACLELRQGDAVAADASLARAVALLGNDLAGMATGKWSEPLRQLPAFPAAAGPAPTHPE
jgi:Tfp pilus assembly protein PilF